ncbi:MAG: CAP domain-containing protein [bacterium]|nr:CAP domain-containing protein [bacterium]
MKKYLKKYLIPHKENGHAPHFLRAKAVLITVSAILVFELAFLAQQFLILPRTSLLALIFPDALVTETNESRVASALGPLAISPVLEAAARLKAQDMAQKSYFAHTSPEGVTPWHWFEEAGYNFNYAGENLAINFLDSSDVTKAWLNSPTHRANILNGRFTEIGIATAEGIYQDKKTTFVVQLFGRPAPVAVIPAQPETSEEKLPAQEPREIASSQTEQETFVAVKGAEAELAEEKAISPLPNPEIQEAVENPIVAAVEKAAASPRNTANLIFVAFAAVMAVALALKIFIKIKIQHPVLIMNGLLVLALIGILVVTNERVSLALARIL